MASVIAIIREKRYGIAKIGLIILFFWFAAPKAQSYSPTVNPQLRPQLVQQILLHLELAKQNSSDSTVKQLVIIFHRSEKQTEQRHTSKLPEVCIGLNCFYCNSFYVHTTINAP